MNIFIDDGGGGSSPTWQTTFEQAGAGSNSGSILNFTIRDVIEAGNLIAGSKIRITFKGGSGGGFAFSECWIGPRGSGFEFASAPTQLMFGGSATGSASGDVDLVSDEVVMSISGSDDLVVSFWMGSGGFGGSMKVWSVASGPGDAYYLASTNAADDVPGAGFSADVSTTIRKVEVYA